MDRQEPNVIFGLEPQQRPTLALGVERVVALNGHRVAFGLLILLQLGGVDFVEMDFRAIVARAVGILHIATDVNLPVFGPVVLVLIVLERPLHAHRVRLHPVDRREPPLADRRTQREHGVVLRRIRVASRMLVEIITAIVGRIANAGRHARHEPFNRIALAVGTQRFADDAASGDGLGFAHFDDLHREDIGIATSIVIDHYALARQLSGRIQDLRLGVDVQSAHDLVLRLLGYPASDVRLSAVAQGQQLGVAHELHELAGERNRRSVVRRIRPVDAPRTPRAAHRDGVGHLVSRAVLQDPFKGLRPASNRKDARIVAVGVEEKTRNAAVFRRQLAVAVVGRIPVDIRRRIDAIRKIILRLGALPRKADLRFHQQNVHSRRVHLFIGDIDSGKASGCDKHRIRRQPHVLRRIANIPNLRRARRTERVDRHLGERRRNQSGRRQQEPLSHDTPFMRVLKLYDETKRIIRRTVLVRLAAAGRRRDKIRRVARLFAVGIITATIISDVGADT